MSARSRADGERVRMRHQLDRLSAIGASLELGLADLRNPPRLDDAQALMQVAGEISSSIAMCHAYTLAARDEGEK